jgi:hypothetical protein
VITFVVVLRTVPIPLEANQKATAILQSMTDSEGAIRSNTWFLYSVNSVNGTLISTNTNRDDDDDDDDNDVNANDANNSSNSLSA